jgi:sigma-B regulation protein RsbU (phosphoserine phosphatase)
MSEIIDYAHSSYSALRSLTNPKTMHAKAIPSDARILVVDDDRLYQEFLSHTLKKAGAKHIHIAATGIEAIALAKLHDPHLIILDLTMPEMDGFTCCKTLRSMDAFKNTPIIIQTGAQDEISRLKIFELGASDYLSKPVNTRELVARSCVHIERSMLHRNIKSHLNLLQRDIAIAKSMQTSLLPSPHDLHMLEQEYSLKISSYYHPSEAVGGDTWGIRTLSEHEFLVYSCDFSSRGVCAAINIFRFQTMLKDLIVRPYVPSDWMSELNQAMCDLLPIEQFAKAFFAVINTDNNTLTYCGAGSPRPIFTQQQGATALLNTRGFPVGIVPDAEYNNHRINFEKGDSLFIYSDAITKIACFNDTVIDDNELRQMAHYHFEDARRQNQETTTAHYNLFHAVKDAVCEDNQKVIDDVMFSIITRL